MSHLDFPRDDISIHVYLFDTKTVKTSGVHPNKCSDVQSYKEMDESVRLSIGRLITPI